ncbi:MAG: MarR family transcriptional regulator [Candidatus Hodarchaeales archaeon]|jgi:DNA-binding transcriptional regulator GbsR (MarR family)
MSPQYRFIRWYGELTKRFGMSELIGRLAAVLLLHRKKEISLQELADWTEYSLSAISQTIDTFVRMGFVERRKRKGDRRAFFCTRHSLPEIMQLMLQMILAEEIRPAVEELRKELDKTQIEMQSSIVEEKEELAGKIATIESLLKESNLMERYLIDLLALELPKPEE